MRHVNVLIAEGDVNVRSELKALLTEQGHTTVGEADTGPKCLVLARNLRPELVLVDIFLPQLSGFEVAKVITEEGIAPVILLGKEIAVDLGEKAEACGAMGFLSKPARPSDFLLTIQISVARWRRLSELDTEVRSLNERMEARKLVGRAKAILMERFGLQERDAFRRIQAQSAALNKPVHEIARAIITAHDVSI